MSHPERVRRSWLGTLSGWPLMLGLLAASLALGRAAPMIAIDGAFQNHRLALLAVTGAVALAGFVMFFIGVFLRLMDDDAEPSTDASGNGQVPGLAGLRRLPHALRGSAYHFSGTASTVQAEDTFSVADLKRAGPKLLSDPISRRRTLAVIGGLIMIFGGFACAFVAVPAGLKPLIAVFMLYAWVRLGWGYYTAR